MELCLPIVIDGVTIGLLTVGSPNGDQLGERDMSILRAVADRLAAALALSLERDLVAASGRRFSRLSAVARELGTAVEAGDDGAFWTRVAESARDALGAEVTILGSDGGPGDGSTWRQLAGAGGDQTTEQGASVLAIADAALAGGPSVDGPRNLAAVRLDGWHHPVAMISVSPPGEARGEILRQLAVALEPVLRLRAALTEQESAGQAGLTAFYLAVDWAVARAGADAPAATQTVIVIESLDGDVSGSQLGAEIRAGSPTLVAQIGPQTVGVVIGHVPEDGSSGAASDLVSAVARTRRVVAGISAIGPDLAAAAFERATGALELARRLGPGNTVVA
jgi:hypothetical protein